MDTLPDILPSARRGFRQSIADVELYLTGKADVGNNWTAATNDSVSAPLIIKMSGERQNVGFPTFYRQHEEVDFKSIVPGVYHAEGGTLSVEPFLSNQHLPRENLQTIIDLQ